MILRPETEIIRNQSIATLKDHARPAWIDVMGRYGVKWINYHMVKAWNQSTKMREEKIKIGRPLRIPKLLDFGPGRNKKGGVNWYRYQVDVLPYLLDDFERFQRKVGPEALLI